MRLLLIHGMGRTPLSLALLGQRLSQQGHRVRYFGYAAFYESFDHVVARLVATLYATADQQPYALIGHSLGSILARAALPALTHMPPRQLVMLAPPNQAPLLARRLSEHLLYRLTTRDCGSKLADTTFYETLPQPTIRTTIIAGTAGPRGHWSPFGDQPNDGVVAVEETRLGPDIEVILVASVHTLIMNSPQVTQIICALLTDVQK
ncbi:MAG: thioesterase domain-containing protein [Roseiflexaceae bacterium]